MKDMVSHFVKAHIVGMCVYGSALLKEQLAREGIQMTFVAGYLRTSRGEFYRHVWLETQESPAQIYDIGVEILKQTAWKDCAVKYKHHYTLISQVRTDLETVEQKKSASAVEHGIELYQRDPLTFWAEFDSSDSSQAPALAQVINSIRDRMLDMD